jgi:hypothetical protein
MTEEEKELRLIKQMLQELTSNAKSKSDLGVNLVGNLSSKFDDYLCQQAFDEKVSAPSKSFMSLIDWFRQVTRLLNYGPPYPDVMTRNFIEGLGENGELTRAQMRVINIYRMIRFESNGTCSILHPSSKDYSKAKVMVGILLLLTPLLAMVVWGIAACIMPGLPFGFLMGAILGMIWRDVYNFAWGRDRLVKYLLSKHQWLKIEQQGLAA